MDEYALTLSGNTVGLYWDISDGSGTLDSKITNTGSEILAKSYFLDPTVSHSLAIASYFKTKTGAFKKLKDFAIDLPAENPYILYDGKTVSNATDLQIKLKTNKLGKYVGFYDIVSSQ